jgi:hypothetical protein
MLQQLPPEEEIPTQRIPQQMPPEDDTQRLPRQMRQQMPPEEDTQRLPRQQKLSEEDTQRLPRQQRLSGVDTQRLPRQRRGQQMPPEAQTATGSLPGQQVPPPDMASQPLRRETPPQPGEGVPGQKQPNAKRFGWFGGLALVLAAGAALLFGIALTAPGDGAITAEPAAEVTATATATEDASESPLPGPAKTVQSEPKETSKTVEAVKATERQWAKVVKNPDAYIGQRYIIYGQVTQLDSATGTDTFRAETAHTVTTEYGFYEGADTVLTGDEEDLSDLVEGDVFRASVTVIGSFDDDTNMAGNKTVPYLTVNSLKVVS